jgi:hypothetical protein
MVRSMGWVRRHWRKVTGGIVLLWEFARGIVTWGGDIDFLISVVKDIGWVGLVIAWLLSPPDWFGPVAIVVGLALIYWDSKRKLPEPVAGPTFASPETNLGPPTLIPVAPRRRGANIPYLDLPISEQNLLAYANSSQLLNRAAKQMSGISTNETESG